MKRFIHALRIGVASTSAWGGASCPKYPKTEWMPEAEAKGRLIAQGYTIDKFKIDCECYEIYGKNKEGKKPEVYFDAKTLAIVKAEIGR